METENLEKEVEAILQRTRDDQQYFTDNTNIFMNQDSYRIFMGHDRT
jgi:hypothetical protein